MDDPARGGVDLEEQGGLGAPAFDAEEVARGRVEGRGGDVGELLVAERAGSDTEPRAGVGEDPGGLVDHLELRPDDGIEPAVGRIECHGVDRRQGGGADRCRGGGRGARERAEGHQQEALAVGGKEALPGPPGLAVEAVEVGSLLVAAGEGQRGDDLPADLVDLEERLLARRPRSRVAVDRRGGGHPRRPGRGDCRNPEACKHQAGP